MSNKQKNQLMLYAVAAMAVFLAICAITPALGDVGERMYAQIYAALGRARFLFSFFCLWAVIIGWCNSKRQLRRWGYCIIASFFLCAVLDVLQGGGYGHVIGGFSASVVGSIGFVGLLLFASVVCSVPFLGRGNLSSLLSSIFSATGDSEGGADAEGRHVGRRIFPGQGYIAKFEMLLNDKRFLQSNSLVPIGISQQSGKILSESLDEAAHFLVAGKTGSGKTVFLQTAIAALILKNTPNDLNLILIDGVRRGLLPFVEVPHVLHDDIISEDTDMIAALTHVTTELNARIQNDVRTPKLITVIDEIDGFFIDKQTKKTIEPMITKIVKSGRQFGVHLLMGSQRPSGDLISAHILSMMTRVCLRVELPKYSKNIIESPEGATLRGNGDLLYYHSGQLTRAQGFYLSPGERQDIINKFATMKDEPPFELFHPRRAAQVIPFSMNIHRNKNDYSSEYSLNNHEYSDIQPETERQGVNIQNEYSEVEQIKQLAANGMTIQAIANTLDLPYSRVQRTLKKVRVSGIYT